MRGSDGAKDALFTVGRLENVVPADYPLRPIRLLVEGVLGRLTPRDG